MNIGSMVSRLRNGDLAYALGRFKSVRSAYSRFRGLSGWRSDVPAEVSSRQTLFPGVDIEQAADTIREDAVFVGMNLPPHVVADVEHYARTTPLFARHDPQGPKFLYHEVVGGRTPDGRRVPTGPVPDPLRCDAVRAVVEDPGLRALARAYLGYQPRGIVTILSWNFASDISDEERRKLKHHVIDYHYDVGGLNFVYASFYILDTDRDSGAHVMMKKSHDRKPLRMLFGSATAPEAKVHEVYGKENEIIIEGPAGTGFMQDTACYHRAGVPTKRDRLMLQVRFN